MGTAGPNANLVHLSSSEFWSLVGIVTPPHFSQRFFQLGLFMSQNTHRWTSNDVVRADDIVFDFSGCPC